MACNTQKGALGHLRKMSSRIVSDYMGVNTGAGGAAFAALILSVGTACRTNKIRG